MMVSAEKLQPMEILSVVDNPLAVMMTSNGLNDNGVCNNLHIATNAEEAMDFLYKRGKYASAPSPEIILLDLDLPGQSGRDLLAEITADSSLRHIPVVVLIASEDQGAMWKCYSLRANCFIIKPLDTEQFIKALECLGSHGSLWWGMPLNCKSKRRR